MMRNVKQQSSMCIVLILFVVTQCTTKTNFAQSARPTSQQWAWINEEWKKSDLPFKKIRLDLDKSAVQDKDALLLVNQYKALSKKEMANAKAQFKWAYAAYQAATRKVPGAELELAQVKQVLTTTVPKNYETARLRFLIEARGIPRR